MDLRNISCRVFLPAIYIGSPRFMSRCYQDSMAIVYTFGRPALFITFTINPNWREIQDLLRDIPGQTPNDRPNVIARVFNIKVKNLLRLIRH